MNLAVDFELEDLEHNPPRRRFYRLRLEPDTQLALPATNIAPGFVIIVARGRIGGRKPILRREAYPRLERAIERYGQLAARRRSRGYVEAPAP